MKILLADDSITIQKVVNLTFADEGVEVISVSNGDLAERQLAEVKPDLVLADVFMPGKNGYELCQYIKESPQFAHIPVVLLVGAFEPFDEAEAARVRADAHLTKPFESRALIETVFNLVGGRGRASQGEQAEEPLGHLLDSSQPDQGFDFSFEAAPDQAAQFDPFGQGEPAAEFGSIPDAEPVAIDEPVVSGFGSVPGELDQAVLAEPVTVDEPVATGFGSIPGELDQVASAEPVAIPEFGSAPGDLGQAPLAEPVAVDEPVATGFGSIPGELDQATLAEPVTADESVAAEFGSIPGEAEPVAFGEPVVSGFGLDQAAASEPSVHVAWGGPDSVSGDFSADRTVLGEVPVAEFGASDSGEPSFQAASGPGEPSAADRGQFVSSDLWASSEARFAPVEVEAFPPALIDEIVRRVLARMSDEVVREVAWEVVPDCVERVVENLTRELLSKRG